MVVVAAAAVAAAMVVAVEVADSGSDGEWRMVAGNEGERDAGGGGGLVVVMVVPVVVASDGVAISLLRKAGLLDTANASRAVARARERESCVIKINNSTTSMHSLVRDDGSICRPARSRLRAFSPPFSHLLSLSLPFSSPEAPSLLPHPSS